MTAALPAPRTPEEGSAPMLTYIAESVRDLDRSLERGLESIRQQLAELPSLYVPRRELERRLDELTVDIGEVRASHEAAERDRENRQREDRRERRNLRLAIAGTAIAGASATTGVVALLFPHLS